MFRRVATVCLVLVVLDSGRADAFRAAYRTSHCDEGSRCINIHQRIAGLPELTKHIKNGYDDSEDMKAAFGEKTILCKLILNPDGSVEDVKIAKSSGSKKYDSEAMRLIRKAGPFYSSAKSIKLAYWISLPKLHVAGAPQ